MQVGVNQSKAVAIILARCLLAAPIGWLAPLCRLAFALRTCQLVYRCPPYREVFWEAFYVRLALPWPLNAVLAPGCRKAVKSAFATRR